MVCFWFAFQKRIGLKIFENVDEEKEGESGGGWEFMPKPPFQNPRRNNQNEGDRVM